MNLIVFRYILALGIALIATRLLAQTTQPIGQTVQLPTVSNFSIQTDVLVPDQGSASLGGVSRSASGSTYRSGIPTNRSIGSSMGSSHASVHVQIIDLDALDKAILGAANVGQQSTQKTKSDIVSALNKIGDVKPDAASELADYVRGRSQVKRIPEYTYILEMHESTSRSIERYPSSPEDVRQFLLKARQAKHDGRWLVADVYMQQAWQRLTPQGRQLVLDAIKEKEAQLVAAKKSASQPTNNVK